jgi:soluble lytic murein transglycosylase
MQMIPPTAEEVAADIGWKNLKLPDDLYDPATNLKFCSYYLAKVLGQFGGHLPLALASYNAGPKRIGDWYQARGLQMTLTSEPKQEIWIDELPWNEPRYYVKAILRNIILYRVLDKGRVQISDPIWK